MTEDKFLQEKAGIENIGEIRATLRFYRELFSPRGITDNQKNILLLEADRLIKLGETMKRDVHETK